MNQALAELYHSATGERLSPAILEQELARERTPHRRIGRMHCEGSTGGEIGAKLGITRSSVRSSLLLTMRAIRKRALDLPRYHQRGHPGPPAAART